MFLVTVVFCSAVLLRKRVKGDGSHRFHYVQMDHNARQQLQVLALPSHFVPFQVFLGLSSPAAAARVFGWCFSSSTFADVLWDDHSTRNFPSWGTETTVIHAVISVVMRPWMPARWTSSESITRGRGVPRSQSVSNCSIGGHVWFTGRWVCKLQYELRGSDGNADRPRENTTPAHLRWICRRAVRH